MFFLHLLALKKRRIVRNMPFGKVKVESLKVRSGLSTENTQTGLLSKDDTLHIYGKVDNWYIIRTENNLVGAVFADYVEIVSDENVIPTSSNIEIANEKENQNVLSQDEQIFLNLINNKRIENNLPEFQIDETLLNLARLKAKDIVENKYFSHNSPTYGTIFDMLSNSKFPYSSASENIAKSLNADGALQLFMKSESHKRNILSNDFNYTGIAVANSIEYGKVFVEIFVGK